MKRLVVIAAIALFAAASAQDIATFKQRLASPVKVDSLTTINATVKVTEHLDAANIVATTPPPLLRLHP
ncbi:MAG: hypothetical protein II262_08190, partial [Alistipes sp.]|nr:hypothetical protein [Alistipes sp.]